MLLCVMLINSAKKIIFLYVVFFPICIFSYQQDPASRPVPRDQNVVIERQKEEKEVLDNKFAITLHKPNYILPFYYTGSPYNAVYINETPSNESLKHSEIKYQLSFKVPLWNNILTTPTSLYLAYTQLSYWQLYNKKSFFRSTDYEPELFTQTKLNWNMGHNWFLNSIKFGAVHQSNGFGNTMERSWNRVYLEVSASNEHGLISIQPWYIFHDNLYHTYNPDMAKYLGYGEIILAYKFNQQTISLQAHSLIENRARYATGIVRYTFPIINQINGFVELFSGYGQSLIEYNHRTNSVGVGLALNNYI